MTEPYDEKASGVRGTAGILGTEREEEGAEEEEGVTAEAMELRMPPSFLGAGEGRGERAE